MKCPVCGKETEQGDYPYCNTWDCPMKYIRDPDGVTMSHITDLVPDMPRPVETAPLDTLVMLHGKNGEKMRAKLVKWPIAPHPIYCHAMGGSSFTRSGYYETDDFIGWTPVEDVKP